MKFTLVDRAEADKWNEFVRQACNPSILQSFEWGLVKSHTWNPLHCAVVDDQDNFVITALVLARRIPLSGRCIFYSPRGPVCQDFATAPLDFFFGELKKLARRQRAILLRLDPEIEEGSKTIDRLEGLNLRHNPENIQPRATIMVDMRPDEDALLNSFHHKTRYNIRLSARKGVTAKQLNSREGIGYFYKLFRETSERNKFMILKESYFVHLWETLDSAKSCVIFAAFLGDEPLAVIFQTIFGDRMTYLYGASSDKHRNLMPSHLVHWEAIKWAKSTGLKEYDMWGIPSNPDKGHPLWGVYRFKKGFCERETKWAGTYEMIYQRIGHMLFSKAIPALRGALRLFKTGKIRSSLGE